MPGWKRGIAAVFLVGAGVMAYSFAFNYPVAVWSARAVVPNSRDVIHAAGEKPDHIILTPRGDCRTMAAISWRTAASVTDGVVQYARADEPEPVRYLECPSVDSILVSGELTSDVAVRCHAATLTGLTPGATYRYRVGSGTADVWSEYLTFTTAPAVIAPFSFVFFGDTQTGPAGFGALLAGVERRHPDTAFYLIAGDLVDKGDYRNGWDEFLAGTSAIFSRKPLAPAMGNHDYGGTGAGAGIFAAYFDLPGGIREETGEPANYSFMYGNVCFLVVNSLETAEQTQWIENELRRADEMRADFRVAMFHVPVYHPKKNRSNRAAQKHWVPLFDKYGVDLVLSGHDHSYLRSQPLRGGRPHPDGTVYVVATACDKFYPYKKLDIARTQLADTVTYQVIAVGVDSGGRPALRYTAYNPDGEAVDAFGTIK